MIRAHKIRLNPTPEQEVYFKKAAGTKRFVYNWALARWQWAKSQGMPVYGMMAAKLDFNAIKREQFPWVYEVAKDVCEGAFQDLGTALKNYFDFKNGKRKGEKVGFPKFKSKKRSRQSFRLNNDKFQVDDHRIRIPNLGWVNMAECLRFTGKIMGAVVSRVADHWFVSISVEIENLPRLVPSQGAVGIDMGLKTLATLSDGVEFENQKLLRSELAHLKRLSRRLSRRKEGSNRWWAAKRRLASFYERIANRRADILHKMTTEIARRYRLVAVETLNIKGMARNRRLALSVADAGMGEALRQLAYKAQQLVKVSRWYASSKTCSDCGYVHPELTISDRTWLCAGCGVMHERDFNAAINILQEGLRLAST
jgi:putative transposase